MVMTIELRISGLVAFYRSKRKQFWNAVFICDADHPVNFRNKSKADWAPLHIKGRDRFISIIADRANEPDSLQGKDFKKILNMTRKEMHGVGNLSVERSGATDIISMIIPAAKLGMSEQTPFKYYVINNTTHEYSNVGTVGRVATATIKLSKGKGFTMFVQDGAGAVELAHFPFKDGATRVLEFNNDCGIAGKAENDFVRYYDWLKDKNGTTCWAGRIDDVLARAEENRDTQTKSLKELVGILSSENGNCDIVVIEPPPPKQP